MKYLLSLMLVTTFACEHCGKRLGSRIVQASCLAKELGLRRIKK